MDLLPSTKLSFEDRVKPYMYDQLNLFADLENEEELEAEYYGKGHCAAEIGDIINNKTSKYFVTRKIGFGNFSLAWLVIERNEKLTRGAFRALKIFKAQQSVSTYELQVLRKVKNHDHIVQLYDTFDIRRNRLTHKCFVFEPLGSTLLKLLHIVNSNVEARDVGLRADAIKKIVKHVLNGLMYLNQKLNFVHADIKPENIMSTVTSRSLYLAADEVWENEFNGNGMRAVNRRNVPLEKLNNVIREFKRTLRETPQPYSLLPLPEVQDRNTVSDEICWNNINFKLIDLGNATKEGSTMVAGTFEYRAPENVFRAPLKYNFDTWSVGVVMIELITNCQLFRADDPDSHSPASLLTSITRWLGKLPRNAYEQYGNNGGLLEEFTIYRPQESDVRKNLRTMFSPDYYSHEETEDMVDFLMFVLNCDPKKRPNAADCLKHKWLC